MTGDKKSSPKAIFLKLNLFLFRLDILLCLWYIFIRKNTKIAVTKLKVKNQFNIPLEPPYSPEELKAIDKIVEQEKDKAKIVKPGKKFSVYIRKIFKKFQIKFYYVSF